MTKTTMTKTTMTKATMTAVVAAMFVALGACGNDSTDSEITQSEAIAVSEATMAVTGQAESRIFPSLADKLSQVGGEWISGTPDSFTFSGTVDNPNGGSATISGTGGRNAGDACGGVAATPCPDGQRCVPDSREPDATGRCVPAAEWNLDLTVTFNNWASEALGQPIDGSLAVSYEIQTLAPRSFVMTAAGTVKVGLLPVGVDLTVTAASGQVSVCGTIAGQPIDNGNCQ